MSFQSQSTKYTLISERPNLKETNSTASKIKQEGNSFSLLEVSNQKQEELSISSKKLQLSQCSEGNRQKDQKLPYKKEQDSVEYNHQMEVKCMSLIPGGGFVQYFASQLAQCWKSPIQVKSLLDKTCTSSAQDQKQNKKQRIKNLYCQQTSTKETNKQQTLLQQNISQIYQKEISRQLYSKQQADLNPLKIPNLGQASLLLSQSQKNNQQKAKEELELKATPQKPSISPSRSQNSHLKVQNEISQQSFQQQNQIKENSFIDIKDILTDKNYKSSDSLCLKVISKEQINLESQINHTKTLNSSQENSLQLDYNTNASKQNELQSQKMNVVRSNYQEILKNQQIQQDQEKNSLNDSNSEKKGNALQSPRQKEFNSQQQSTLLSTAQQNIIPQRVQQETSKNTQQMTPSLANKLSPNKFQQLPSNQTSINLDSSQKFVQNSFQTQNSQSLGQSIITDQIKLQNETQVINPFLQQISDKNMQAENKNPFQFGQNQEKSLDIQKISPFSQDMKSQIFSIFSLQNQINSSSPETQSSFSSLNNRNKSRSEIDYFSGDSNKASSNSFLQDKDFNDSFKQHKEQDYHYNRDNQNAQSKQSI